MTLALKNGAVIVKDGKLAEDCGCCGWYCDGGDLSCKCLPTAISSVSISVTASDFIRHSRYRDSRGTLWYLSFLSVAAHLNGTHSLTPDTSKTFWTKSFGLGLSNLGGCVYCPSSSADITVTSEDWLTAYRISAKLCTYHAWIARNESVSGMPQYFERGDQVSVASGGSGVFGPTVFTFGGSQGAGLGDTYNPYAPLGPRVVWWNTAADCHLVSSQCFSGVRAWNPSLPSVYGRGGSGYYYRVPYDPSKGAEVIDKMSGTDSTTINSVDVSY
jgi:hypothetical protein